VRLPRRFALARLNDRPATHVKAHARVRAGKGGAGQAMALARRGGKHENPRNRRDSTRAVLLSVLRTVARRRLPHATRLIRRINAAKKLIGVCGLDSAGTAPVAARKRGNQDRNYQQSRPQSPSSASTNQKKPYRQPHKRERVSASQGLRRMKTPLRQACPEIIARLNAVECMSYGGVMSMTLIPPR